jgi:Protein of unknown function (DUF2817)
VHALNPHGFSWWRRTTHENVDLNRNWHNFNAPLPVNAGYEEIAPYLVPSSWPPSDANEAALMAYAAQHGAMGLQAAISGGQYRHPSGLFYGGLGPTWSNTTLRQVLRSHAQRCTRLGWIDLHTGLGPSGHGEIIFSARNEPTTLARARAWWGSTVTSTYDGSSTSAPLVGMMFGAAYDECPQAVYTGMALEYGTLPVPDMLQALRADQWLQSNPGAPAAQATAIKKQIRDAFYTDTPAWKQAIVEQGLRAAHQAVQGLAAA